MKKIFLPVLILLLAFLVACGEDSPIDTEAFATQASEAVSDVVDSDEVEETAVSTEDVDDTTEEETADGQAAETTTEEPAVNIEIAGSPAVMIENNDSYYRLISMGVEEDNKCLEGNGGPNDDSVLGGATFMDDCQNVTGQLWKFIETDDDGYYRLISMGVEDQDKSLESNGGPNDGSVLGGRTFMDNAQNVTGQLWKFIETDDDGYYRLTSMGVEGDNKCLESNGGPNDDSVLGGATFMDDCQNVTGQLWKFVPEGDASVELPSDRWAGSAITTDGSTASDVSININGVETQSDANGAFELSVPQVEDVRYVINAEKDGYLPISQIHIGAAIEELTLEFQPVETFIVDPTGPIDVADSRGTQIEIEPNSLVDEAGNPATEELTMSMYTYDLTEEEMVGDMGGINTEGEEVYMESAGAFYAEFEDDAGNEYNLADGAEAEISIPVEEERPEEVLTVWSYNPETGLWEEEGEAVLVNGRYEAKVSHFSSWNFDWEKSEPACVKLNIAQDYLDANSPVQVRAILQTNPVTVRDMSITEPASGLHNLPTNTDIKFYLSPNYETPFTTANSGAPWGGIGVPASPYDVCNGVAEIAPTPVPGIIQGTKFQDTNNNGVQDSGEPGLPGWTIEVRDNAGNLTTSAITDDAGNYQTLLFAGDYTISEVQQDGWTQTSPASGSHIVAVQSGGNTTDIDFGNHFDNSCSVPVDIVFVIDVTASMGDAIGGVKEELNKILNDISGTSGGDYQLGLVTFNDDVFVLNDLQANNLTSIKENINGLSASGGDGYPESSDEALNTVLNGLAARENQTGNFTNTWRPNARKHIILVTNEAPGGFDDAYSDADKINAESLAQIAANNGIKIDAIHVPGGLASYATDTEAIMRNYANTTGGAYFLTNANGSNAGAEILNIITTCTGTVEGKITNAVNNDVISSAQVCIQPTNMCTTTDADGTYKFDDVPDGDYTLEVTADGYIEITDEPLTPITGGTIEKSMAMSPVLAVGELRIVLQWREDPEDLDSYLWYPAGTVPLYYVNMSQVDPSSTNPRLDTDALDGPGPETITLPVQENGTYQYAVKYYDGAGSITTSNAIVRVYRGNAEIGNFPAPAGVGVWWHVFDLDGATGIITPVNTLSDNSPQPVE